MATGHPCVCGEHLSAAATAAAYSGSSPRLRGTPFAKGFCRTPSRFIPASAGNTGRGMRPGSLPTVHPRVCGEHFERISPVVVVGGSSPRLRGTLPPWSAPCRQPRFIPASAGNTCPWRRPACLTTVHPRVCGEHARLMPSISHNCGSSPRLRGTPKNKQLIHNNFSPT